MKILVLDNYDSFVYNLVHIIRELGFGDQLEVHRNDKISLEAVGKYDKILLSPGPGIPEEAGIMLDLIDKYASGKSILGVCLGHQAIGEVFGAKLFNMPEVLHGIETPVHITDKEEYLFKGVPETLKVCRYHSWAVEKGSVNDSLKITSLDDNQIVMGLSHVKYDVRGVQFHPESVITEHGKIMVKNWLEK